MQASHSSIWTPPTGVLGGIVAEAHARVEKLRADRPALQAMAREGASAPKPPSFYHALRRPCLGVIAEVKRKSPSKGAINGTLSAPTQALEYEAGGAAAVSILTEPVHFGGSIDDLRAAHSAVRLPLLRKDFHVHEVQLIEARAAGAAAVLLIARALAPNALKHLTAFASDISLEPLVEVRDQPELDRALEAGARVIGVNNRNLETLAIDPSVGDTLIAKIPTQCVAIWESGVAGVSDVLRAARAGADAVLVGSSISASGSPAAAVRALSHIGRGTRVPGP